MANPPPPLFAAVPACDHPDPGARSLTARLDESTEGRKLSRESCQLTLRSSSRGRAASEVYGVFSHETTSRLALRLRSRVSIPIHYGHWSAPRDRAHEEALRNSQRTGDNTSRAGVMFRFSLSVFCWKTEDRAARASSIQATEKKCRVRNTG